jgi:hypothetical protein
MRTILHVAQLAAGQKEVPALTRDRQAVSSNELLGFPPHARVLIVNADDCGMDAAVNAAVIDSIDHGHSELAQPDGAVSGHAHRRARPLNRMFCARRPAKPDQNDRHS